MADVAEVDRPVEARGRAHGRRWVIVSVVAALATVFAVGAIVFVSRYAYARALSNDGGSYGWESPDDVSTRFVRIGENNGLTVAARPGASQSFYFEIRNDSPVTQTLLGLADTSTHLAWQEHLAVATKTDYRLAESEMAYRSEPVALPPHADRFVRVTVDTPRCPGTVTQFWDSVSLRVRVGAFTSTQTVRLGTTIFQIEPPKTSC